MGLTWDTTTAEHCANFLAKLRSDGLGYSAINTARSALSAAVRLEDGTRVGNIPLVARVMRGGTARAEVR